MTIERDPPYPGREALRWAWTVLLQVKRVRKAQKSALAASRESSRRGHYGRDTAERFYELDAERHFLLVAAHNLTRALDYLGDNLLPDHLEKDVKLLRDCYEHWDEHKAAFEESGHRGRALRNHAERAGSTTRPDQHQWGPNGTLLGGILSVEELEDVAKRIYDELRARDEDGDLAILPPLREEE